MNAEIRLASEHLTETVDKCYHLLLAISAADAEHRPAPGKWSVKEIIGHLLDSAANNHQKFVRTMESSSHSFPPYAQDSWVSRQNYQSYDWEMLLDLWRSYNHFLAHVMLQVREEEYKNEIFIADKGPFTLSFIMTDYVEHLKHHLIRALPGAGLKSDFSMIY